MMPTPLEVKNPWHDPDNPISKPSYSLERMIGKCGRVEFYQQTGPSVIAVFDGHVITECVTKEGAIAGPRVVEHMVDTVLYFESDPASRYTLIRSVKNRFGISFRSVAL